MSNHIHTGHWSIYLWGLGAVTGWLAEYKRVILRSVALRHGFMEAGFNIKEGLSLFYDNRNGWILKGGNGMYYIETDNFSIYLFPLLECDYDHFIKEVRKNIHPEKIKDFPLLLLLKKPFEEKMIYWANLSLDWIEKSSSMDELASWSSGIQLDWMPQNLKHRFLKVFALRSNQS